MKKSKPTADPEPSSTTPAPASCGEVQSANASDNTASTADNADVDSIAAILRRSGRARSTSVRTLFKSRSAASLAPSIPSTVMSSSNDDSATKRRMQGSESSFSQTAPGSPPARPTVYPLSRGRHAKFIPRKRRESNVPMIKPEIATEKVDKLNVSKRQRLRSRLMAHKRHLSRKSRRMEERKMDPEQTQQDERQPVPCP